MTALRPELSAALKVSSGTKPLAQREVATEYVFGWILALQDGLAHMLSQDAVRDIVARHASGVGILPPTLESCMSACPSLHASSRVPQVPSVPGQSVVLALHGKQLRNISAKRRLFFGRLHARRRWYIGTEQHSLRATHAEQHATSASSRVL